MSEGDNPSTMKNVPTRETQLAAREHVRTFCRESGWDIPHQAELRRVFPLPKKHVVNVQVNGVSWKCSDGVLWYRGELQREWVKHPCSDQVVAVITQPMIEVEDDE